MLFDFLFLFGMAFSAQIPAGVLFLMIHFFSCVFRDMIANRNIYAAGPLLSHVLFLLRSRIILFFSPLFSYVCFHSVT